MPNDNDDKRERRRGFWPGIDSGGGSGRPDPAQDRARRTRLILWLLLGVLAALWLFRGFTGANAQEVDYSAFLQRIGQGGEVLTDVRVGDARIEGILHRGDEEVRIFAVRPPVEDNGELIRVLTENQIQYTGSQPSGLANFLLSLIP